MSDVDVRDYMRTLNRLTWEYGDRFLADVNRILNAYQRSLSESHTLSYEEQEMAEKIIDMGQALEMANHYGDYLGRRIIELPKDSAAYRFLSLPLTGRQGVLA